MTGSAPSDAELLAAGGWTEIRSARVVAKAFDDWFCVAVVDSNGAEGAEPYEIVEWFFRDEAGTWLGGGHFGPAGEEGSGGSGDQEYSYRRSSAAPTGWEIKLTATP